MFKITVGMKSFFPFT